MITVLKGIPYHFKEICVNENALKMPKNISLETEPNNKNAIINTRLLFTFMRPSDFLINCKAIKIIIPCNEIMERINKAAFGKP